MMFKRAREGVKNISLSGDTDKRSQQMAHQFGTKKMSPKPAGVCALPSKKSTKLARMETARTIT